MGDDEVRKLILSRRAKFIAAALVSVNAAMTGCDDSTPQPCLSPAYDGGDRDGAVPQPCLSPLPSDAGADAEDGSVPQPCLSPQPPDGGDASDGG